RKVLVHPGTEAGERGGRSEPAGLARRAFARTNRRRGPMLSRLQRQVVDFLRNEDGPTAVEYAVMLALIIVVCITAITALGSNANLTFSTVGSAVGTTGS